MVRRRVKTKTKDKALWIDGRKVSDWVDGTLKPVRRGMYHVQDHSMPCDCCWFDAHWDGRDWHTDLMSEGHFRTLLFSSSVRRWRGLTKPI